MAAYLVVDLTLHFDTFRNIDLFHQGVYYHKVSVYVDRENKEKSFAVPHSFFSSPSTKKSKARGVDVAGSDAFSTPAAILDEQFAFRTRSFLIRYVEEHVDLNDAGNFRVELDMATGTHNYGESERVVFIDWEHGQRRIVGWSDRLGEQNEDTLMRCVRWLVSGNSWQRRQCTVELSNESCGCGGIGDLGRGAVVVLSRGLCLSTLFCLTERTIYSIGTVVGVAQRLVPKHTCGTLQHAALHLPPHVVPRLPPALPPLPSSFHRHRHGPTHHCPVGTDVV